MDYVDSQTSIGLLMVMPFKHRKELKIFGILITPTIFYTIED